MKFSEIKSQLAPFKEQIELIPGDQIQGIKVAGIICTKLESVLNELAYATERIEDLNRKVYGGKPTAPEKPGDPERSEEEKNHAKKAAAEAKKKIQKIRLKHDSPPVGQPEKEVVVHKVPEIICNCCNTKVLDQGYSQSATEIDYIPAKIIEREYRLHRGSCACGEINFVMPRPLRTLEKRTYTPAFIAKLIVDKFRFHLPVYRQTKQLADMGFEAHRGTLNNIILSAWQQLEPLCKAMWEANKLQAYRHLDETPICRIIDKKVSKKYYLWGMYTELAITFELTKTRNTILAKAIAGPGGTVITDGLAIYNPKSITGNHVNCLAHVVQKLLKALPSFPEEAEKALSYLIKVYEVDYEAYKKELNTAQKQALREEKAKPLMEELSSYLESIDIPPRSSLGTAINYILDRWEGLTAFLKDGDIPLDNNPIEAIFKDVKLGLKNFLFVQSDLGGKALAGMYSIIATCELHGVNPYSYIEDVLSKLADDWPASKVNELMPWAWGETQKNAGSDSAKPIKTSRVMPNLDTKKVVNRLGISEKVTIPVDFDAIPPPNLKKATKH